MLLLGLDIGTSSIKASVVDADTQQVIASAQFPESESPISSPQSGWAEQDPEMWWQNTCEAIRRVNSSGKFNPTDIIAIGIAYQMHGLVMVDEQQHVLRPSIIWCDSRAVDIGNRAFESIGSEVCLTKMLNSPANFTASKLAWVKENEPEVYAKCDKIMLPGDFIAMKLTNSLSVSNSGLSEGILWDFQENTLATPVMKAYGFSENLIPTIQPVFSEHGKVSAEIAQQLGLKEGISVTYKAGDQPNNALSLNVLNPNEIAATAGTSGVIYAVTDMVFYDSLSRINSFAHVNHQLNSENRIGILLCINGTGILNRWVKENFGKELSYATMNAMAEKIKIGSEGVLILPFGNGAERMLCNKMIGSHILNVDFNQHHSAHIFRAAQEGIAFSMKYGFDMMQANGVQPAVIRAGRANLFLSDVFTECLVNVTNTPVELYDTDGAKGAALGAGFGVGYYATLSEAFSKLTKLKTIEPNSTQVADYKLVYEKWKVALEKFL